MSTGKALDLLSSQFNVSSDITVSLISVLSTFLMVPQPLQLILRGSVELADGVVLRNDEALSAQIEDGATLIIRQLASAPGAA